MIEVMDDVLRYLLLVDGPCQSPDFDAIEGSISGAYVGISLS